MSSRVGQCCPRSLPAFTSPVREYTPLLGERFNAEIGMAAQPALRTPPLIASEIVR